MKSVLLLQDLSVVILAGGKSNRMGSDKAFLKYNGQPFIEIISNEMLKISADVMVMVGRKEKKQFQSVVDKLVKVVEDEYYIENPMGGMISAIPHLSNPYVSFLACDTPLMKCNVIELLAEKARNHSAAVVTWDSADKNRSSEPLSGVYNVQEIRAASTEAIKKGLIGCKKLISLLSDVNYVDIMELRKIDPLLTSLINVNSKSDLEQLNKV